MTDAPAQLEMLLTTAQLAQLLMIGPERVRQLMKEGYIEKRGRDRVPLVGGVQGYIRFLKDEDRNVSKKAADNRVKDARAREIEIKIAERERQLVATDEACGVIDEVFGSVKTNLAGVPARCTRDLPLRKKIETEIGNALNATAKLLVAQATALRTGSEDSADTTDDDA